MLYLYTGGGSNEIQFTHRTLSDEDEDTILFNASQLLAARGEIQAAGMIATLKFTLVEATNSFNDEFLVLQTTAPLGQYEYIRESISNPNTKKEYKNIFSNIANVIDELGYYIRFIICTYDQTQPSNNWRTELSNTMTTLGSNQALFTFKDSRKLIHEGLNFRSKTEIKIFNGLVKRGLLVFPLPVSVMGKSRRYLEPDFVICYKGKTGILEIHGDKWHPPETAAKEHERRREFTNLGIEIYEIFGADRCWNETEEVIDEFLRAF